MHTKCVCDMDIFKHSRAAALQGQSRERGTRSRDEKRQLLARSGRQTLACVPLPMRLFSEGALGSPGRRFPEDRGSKITSRPPPSSKRRAVIVQRARYSRSRPRRPYVCVCLCVHAMQMQRARCPQPNLQVLAARLLCICTGALLVYFSGRLQSRVYSRLTGHSAKCMYTC